MIVPGLLSYSFLAVSEGKREYKAVALITAMAFIVGATRSVTVGIALFRPDFDAAHRWATAYEISFLGFFPLIPYLLETFLPPNNPKRSLFHKKLITAGTLLAAVFSAVLLFFPQYYIQPHALEDLPHPVTLGGGVFGPVYYIMSGVFLALLLYTAVMVIYIRLRDRQNDFLTTLAGGLTFSIIVGFNVLYSVFTKRYVFDESLYSYSRLLLSLTVFALTAIVAMAQKTSGEAKEVERDRAAVKKSRDELAKVAYRDEMTGYGNRQALFRDFKEKCAPPNKLIIIDIDGLSFVNAYHGYDVGDALIRRVGTLCHQARPKYSHLYRINADTFALVAACSEDDAEEMASRILAGTRSLVLPGAEGSKFTCSIGVATAGEGLGWDTWLNRANSALAKAKLSKDRYIIFDPVLHEDENRRHEIVDGLRRSLDESGFNLLYQPIINADKSIIGAEALIRWIHPRLGPVGPDEFIPIAEATGLISRITQFVVGQAATDFHNMDGPLTDLMVNINLSGRDVTDRLLYKNLERIIRDSGIGDKRIGFEVTETDLVADWEMSIANLRKLKDRGYSIALDDFGTGYSSLSYINEMPLDKLKVDRTFIADIPMHERKIALLDSIIQMGANLKLDMIFEGVENDEQLTFLKNHNCRGFQGYLFAPPMEKDQFKSWAEGWIKTAV
jgi:diguanylate cyclase (GGDEF)-like protein